MFGVCCGCCYRNYALVYIEIEEEQEDGQYKINSEKN